MTFYYLLIASGPAGRDEGAYRQDHFLLSLDCFTCTALGVLLNENVIFLLSLDCFLRRERGDVALVVKTFYYLLIASRQAN